jgi:hypothetical protein
VDQRALVKVKEAIRLKENLHEVIAWQHSRPSVESACFMQSAEPRLLPVAANLDDRPVPHRERRREWLRRAFPDADIDGSQSKTRPR